MRRFRFRPERLLRLERQRERLARHELARAVGALHDLETREERLERSRAACLAADAPAGLGMALAAGLGRQAATVHEARVAAQALADSAAAQWRERKAACGGLDALRERRHAEWRSDLQREELATVDDRNAAQHARRRT